MVGKLFDGTAEGGIVGTKRRFKGKETRKVLTFLEKMIQEGKEDVENLAKKEENQAVFRGVSPLM